MPIFSKIKSTRIYKAVFGYDVFISYSRKDSMDYAYSISQYLIKKKYVPYIDQLSSTKKSGIGKKPKSEISDNVLNAIKNAKGVILIGSLGAQEAKEGDPIVQEIDVFQKKGNNKFLIPISIEDAIDIVNVKSQNVQCTAIEKRLHGLPILHENGASFLKNMPSKDVLLRIENTLHFTKKSEQLRNIAIGTLVTIVVLTGSILLFSSRKIMEKVNEIAAQNITIEKSAKSLKSSRASAAAYMKLEKVLKVQNENLVLLNKKEKKKTDSLKNLYTRQYNSAKEITSEFDKAIEAFPGYESQGQLILFTRLDHVAIEPVHKILINKFIENWKKSNQKPISIKAHYISYRVDDESLDIVKMSSSGSANYNTKISNILARNYMQFFIAQGIPREKISCKGFGSMEPLSMGILFNNRIEIK